MRFAIPVQDGRLNHHFGRSPFFAFIDADPEKKQVIGQRILPAPQHDHGILARFIKENGAAVVIAGGMGKGMQQSLAREGIPVILGAPTLEPAEVVSQYLNGTLATAGETCGCRGHHHQHHGEHDY
ncbi:MAG TPA: NifB/NifX family molybdenum-iron cluster-binding protein [Symbiobacteriaceae bacterium]